MNNKSIIEYDVVRVMTTVLVLIGHATYYTINTPYGGCDYSFFAEPRISIIYQIAICITTIIYAFHMPLYMALSGALFRHKMSGGV